MYKAGLEPVDGESHKVARRAWLKVKARHRREECETRRVCGIERRRRIARSEGECVSCEARVPSGVLFASLESARHFYLALSALILRIRFN